MSMRSLALRLQSFIVALGLAAAMPLQPVQAAQWMDVATISSTLGNNVGRLCTGAGKTDLGCPGYAPFVATNGNVGIGTVTPVDLLDIHKGGTPTHQFPLRITNAYSDDTGVAGTGIAFKVAVATDDTYAKAGILFVRDFGVARGSLHLLNSSASDSSNAGIESARLSILSTGQVGIGTRTPATQLDVSGTLKIASSGEACDANRVGAIKYEGGSFAICQSPANGWENLATTGANSLADRITSNSMAGVIANQTGYISLTTGGVTGTVYFTPGGRLVVQGVSTTGVVSATMLYVQPRATGLNAPNMYFSTAQDGLALMADSTSTTLAAPYNHLNIGTSRPDSGVDDIRFFSTTVSGTRYPLAIKGDTGYAGFGTTAPSTTVDVRGILRVANGADACDTNRLGAIRYTANNFFICRNGSTWETLVAGSSGTMDTDRITSSTTAAVIANQDGGTVSFTLGSTPGAAYMHPVQGFVGPGVSTTGTVSATNAYVSGNINFPAAAGGAMSGMILKNGSPFLHTYMPPATQGNNVFLGMNSGNTTLTSSYNTAVGNMTLTSVTTSGYNSAFGFGVMNSLTGGSSNVGMGVYALYKLQSGTDNVAVGGSALQNILTTSFNTLVGAYTMNNSSSGSENTVVGHAAMQFKNGSYNVLMGRMVANLGGSVTGTTAVGYQAGVSLTTAINNTFLGYRAGANVTTGASNIMIGAGTDAPVVTASNQLNIGNSIYGTGLGATPLIGIGVSAPSVTLHVSGTLRISNGGEACDADRLGAIRYTSNNFQICRNGTTWETMVAGSSGTMDTDRITSSTTAAVIANQDGGTVSFTLGSTPGAAYMHPVLGLVTPGVSATGTVSGAIVATPLVQLLGVSGSAGVSMTQAGDNLGNHTATQALDMATQNIINAGSITASGNIKTAAALQSGNTDTACAGAADYGKMRFDSATKRLFLCRP